MEDKCLNCSFGPERGRDILLVVGHSRFHVHSVIMQLFLGGKVFDTLVEQAYENSRSELTLCDDNPDAWHMLLQWIYAKASNPTHPWAPNDAVAVVPLVHKYEGDRILPCLCEALTTKRPEMLSIRKPEVADLLASHHMESVVQAWFSDNAWCNYQRVVLFLKESNENRVRTMALSGGQKYLTVERQRIPRNASDKTDLADMIHEIAGMLPTFEPESLALATTLLADPGSRFARSVALAKILSKGGFGNKAMSWFRDVHWRISLEIVSGFFEGDFLEDMNLEIIGRITRELTATHSCNTYANDFATLAAMIQTAVERCKTSVYEQAHLKLIDAIPKSERRPQMTEMLACHGFLHVVLKWIPGMSAEACHELCSSSNQIELVRAASTQVNRHHEEQRKVWQGIETRLRTDHEEQRKLRQALEQQLRSSTSEKQGLEQELRSIAKGKGKGDDCCGYKGKCAGKCGGKCAAKPGGKDPQPANETARSAPNRPRWVHPPPFPPAPDLRPP